MAQAAEKAARLESAAGRHFQKLAAELLKGHAVHQALVLADERGAIPVDVSVEPQAVPAPPAEPPTEHRVISVAEPRSNLQSVSPIVTPPASLPAPPAPKLSPASVPPQPAAPAPGPQPSMAPPQPAPEASLQDSAQDAQPGSLETVHPLTMTLTSPSGQRQIITDSRPSTYNEQPLSSTEVTPIGSEAPVKVPLGEKLRASRFSPFRFNRPAFVLTSTALVIVTLIGLGSLFLAGSRNTKVTTVQSLNNYAASNVNLGNIQPNPQLEISGAQDVLINGQLKVANTLVLEPTTQPSAPIEGQIYFDQTAKVPYFYNGDQFVSLSPEHVTSLGGASGVIGLGAGLSVVNNQLDVAGTLVQQINSAINTAANSGVLSLTGTANQINVSSSTGNITLSLPQDIAVASTPTFQGLTLGGFGAGLVQSSAGGVLSSGAVDRNNSTYFSGVLAVPNGGTGAAAFTANGILYGNGGGALQVTNSLANAVLVTDNGGVPSLSQTLPLAVQDNITHTGVLDSGSITNGFGAISTVNNITTTAKVQAGQLEVDSGSFTVDNSGNFVALGTGDIQAAGGLTIGVAGTTAGSLILANSSNAHLTTLQATSPAGFNQTITIPASSAASDTVCLLTLGNCVGVGGAVSASGGIQNYITKFTNAAGDQIGNSLLYDNGTSVGVNTNVPGASYKLDINGNLHVGGTSTLDNTLSVTAGGASILGTTNINTSGTATTTIGNATGAVDLSGATSVTGSNTFTVGTGATSLGGTLGVTGLSTLSGGASISNGATITGQTNINISGTANTFIGNPTGTLGLASSAFNLSTGGVITGVTGYTQASGNFTQNGAGSFSTGSGAVSLNGAVTAASTLAVQGAGGLTVGVANSTTGKLTFANSGNAFLTSIESAAQANNLALTIPADTNVSDTLCLASLSNCAAAGTAGGDLTGTYPNPTIAKLQGSTLTIGTGLNAPASGQILQFNGTAWVNNTVSGDITINGSGVTTIGNGVVTNAKLANSSLSVIAGTGLSGGGSVSLGASTTLSVAYGSTAGTAVQGNTNLTCPSGTGNLTGGGNSFNLGSGGTCNSLTVVNSPTFSGSLTVQGSGGITVGVAGSQTGSITFAALGSATFTASLQSATQANNVAVTIPADSHTTDTLCLQTLDNCGATGAAGGDLTGTYPNPTIAKLQGTTLTLSALASGDVLQYNGTAIVNGHITNNNLTAGTFSNITGVGALTTGSIASGFGTISTGNNITTTATVQGNILNASGVGAAIELGGADINTAGTLSNVAYLNQANNFSAANTFSAAGTALSVTNSASVGGTLTAGALKATGASGITVGTAGTTAGVVYLANGTNTNLSAIESSAPSGVGNATYTLPAIAGGSSDTICVASLNNCGASGPAGGDLTGTYPNPTIAKLQGYTLTITAPAGGQILQYNGAAWVNQTVSGDVTINSSGVTAIGAGKVTNIDLANSSLSVNPGTGLSGGGSVSLGGSTSLSVVYGSTAGTAVEGNTSLVCPSGTGNLTGTGNTITLGSGGTCNSLTVVNSPTFSGSLTVQGSGGITVGVPGVGGTAGALSLANTTNTNLSTISPTAPSGVGNATYTLPAIAGGSSDTICLVGLNNCAAAGPAGGDLTGTYPNPTIAKLQGYTLTLTAPASGQVLQYNGTAWVNGLITNSNLAAGTFSNITGVGALGAGSITNGFGTISTGNNITTTATVQGGIVNATSALELNGTDINSAGTLTNVAYKNQANTFTASQTISGGFLYVDNNTTSNPTLSRGLAISNNHTNGGGEVDFFSNRATGSTGGYRFYDWNGTLATNLFTIDGSGNTTAAGTVNGATISGGTLSGGTVSGGSLSGTAVNGLSVSGGTITSPTITGTVTGSASPTITGFGTYNGQTISSAANFTGTLTVATSVSTPLLNVTSGSFNVGISSATQANNVALSIPADTHLTDTICLLTLANCAGASGAAGGDLTGTYPNPTIAKLQGSTLTITTPASGDVLQYNGTAFVNGHITNSNLTTGTFSAITGTGALSAGSIASGFGTIVTGNNITTTATVQGGTLNATSTIQLNGTDINTAGTLSNVAYLNASNTFTGTTNTFNATGGNSLAITGAPTNTATTSLIQIGGAISGGNTSANGGTYIGLNQPASGAGSAADFINFQNNGSNKFKIDTFGNTSVNGNLQITTNSLTTGALQKSFTAGTGGVNANDVVVLANDGGNTRVLDTTTSHDIRVLGVAGAAASSGSSVAIKILGNFQVTADTGAVAIGDQLVTSATSGEVTVDNNATTGILGYALSAKAGGASGLVSVYIHPVNGQTNPTIPGNLTVQGAGTSSFGGALTVTGNINGQTISSAGNFTGTLTVQGSGGLTLGVANSATGLLTFANSGSAFTTSIQSAAQANNLALSIPADTNTTDTICLKTLANCAGTGGGVTTPGGTSGTLAVFTGAQTIGNSVITESGSAVSVAGTLSVTGASALTLGTSSTNTGAIKLYNSTNANTLTLQSGASGSNLTFTLPISAGTNGQCLQTDGTGVLSFGGCTGGAGGGVTSIDGLTGVVTLNNSSGAGANITIDNAKADSTTKGIAAFNSTNFTDNGSGVINTAQAINTTATPTFGALTLGAASSLTGTLKLANATNANLSIISPTAPSGVGNATYSLPAIAGGTSDTICLLTAANCAASGTAGGDLTGNYPNPTIAKLQGTTLTLSGLASGDVLQYNGSAIVNGHITNSNLTAGTFSAITGTGALTAGSIASGFGTISTGNNITTTATVQGATVNATSAIQLGGANINTAGTLSNVAYLNQANTFTQPQTVNATSVGTGNALTITAAGLTNGQALNVSGTSTNTAAAEVDMSTLIYTAAPTSSSSSGFTALQGEAKTTAGSFIANNITGVAGYALDQSSSGTVNAARGVIGEVLRNNGGTITSAYAIEAMSPFITAGTIQNAYGVYIGAQAGTGVTNAYGLYQAGSSDNNILAGNTRIGSTTAPSYPLDVTGNINATTGYYLNGTQIVDSSRNLLNIGTVTTTGNINSQTISSAANFTGTLTVQGAGGVTLGVAGTTTGSLTLATAGSASFTTSITSATQANNVAVSIPADTHATDTFCLATLNNCTAIGGAGGDLTGTYPNPTIAKLQGTTLTLSTLVSGDVLQYNGTAIVNGHITNSNLTAGTFSAITGTGALAAGSIATGFGTISTGNNITTTATVQGGIVNATSALELNGTDINSAGTLSHVAYLNQSDNFTGVSLQHNGNNVCDASNNCGYAPSSGGSYLAKNATDTSSAAVTATNNLYTFTNSSSAIASGVLKLDNGTNTNSALTVTASGNPTAGQALIFASNTNASPSGNLIDLQSGSSPTSKFSVTAAGNLTAAGTINGATISGGTLSGGTVSGGTLTGTAVNSLNVSGTAISGTGALTIDANGANTVSIGGISTGDVLLAGGSGATGCTVTNSNGNFACAGNITGATTGTVGYWTRTSGVLQPSTNTDAIQTNGTLSVGSTTAPTGGVAYFNGNVGIGNASPGSKLDVNGIIHGYGGNGGEGEINLSSDSSNTTGRFQIRNETGGWNLKTVDASNLNLFVDNTLGRGITIQDATGNIGIGTTSPQEKLEVAGDSGGNFLVSDTSSSYTDNNNPDYMATVNGTLNAEQLDLAQRSNLIISSSYYGTATTGWSAQTGTSAIAAATVTGKNFRNNAVLQMTGSATSDRLWASGGAQTAQFIQNHRYRVSFRYTATNSFQVEDRDDPFVTVPANTGNAKYFSTTFVNTNTGGCSGGSVCDVIFLINSNTVNVSELTIQDLTTAPTWTMVQDAYGNVGIGTSTPSDLLSLGSGWIKLTDGYGIKGPNGTAIFQQSGGTLTVRPDGSGAAMLNLYGVGGTGMTVDQYGNVGVGVSPTASAGLLQFSAGTTVANGIQFGSDATKTDLYRSAASTLKTDASLAVVGSGTFNGNVLVSNGTYGNTSAELQVGDSGYGFSSLSNALYAYGGEYVDAGAGQGGYSGNAFNLKGANSGRIYLHAGTDGAYVQTWKDASTGFQVTANSATYTGNLLVLTNNGNNKMIVDASGNITAAGNAAINGGSLTSTATTFNLLQSNVTTLNIGAAVGAGGIVLAGGSGSTGCTLDGSTGNFTCSGNITGGSTGTVGYWTRSGTTLSPATTGDNVTTSGNISTTGSGTITSAGEITGQANTTGLALTGTPAASATSSLVQLGGAIAGGNTSANGGTYLGLNEPASGAGSAADYVNFQTNGTSNYKIDNSGNTTQSGNLTVNGTGSSYIKGALALGTANPQAGSALTVPNGQWLSAVDSTGSSYINMFEVNSSNQIQVGAALNIDSGIVLPTDGGQLTFADLPIDSTPTAGTPESYTFRIGSTNVLTVYGEADGAGNAQNLRVAIGSSITPAYTLDVGGDVNVSSGSKYRINGADINTSGTLSNVAYLGQANNFTAANTFSAAGTALSVTNNASIGGTLSVTSTINGATITGGSLSGTAVNGLSVSGGTITNPTITGTVTGTSSPSITGFGTISAGTYNGQTITSAANFTGTLTVQGANALTLGTASTNTGAILFKGSGGANTLTLIGPANPVAGTLTLPNETGTLCSTGSVCTGYAPATGGNYIAKNAADTSSSSVAGNLLGLTNTNTGAGGVLSLTNSGTNSALSVLQSGTSEPGALQALILANNNTTTPTGNLLDLQNKGTSELHVDVSGNLTTIGNIQGVNLTTSGTVTFNSTPASGGTTVLCLDGSNILKACSGTAGSSNFILNGTSTQTANFNIQSASASSVGAVIQGAASQTADLLDVKTSTPATVFSLDANGNAMFKGASIITPGSQTFSYTGGSQTFTVPAGVTSINVTLNGAGGGAGGQGNNGGTGGQTTGTMSVTPGQVLTILVGGAGSNGTAAGAGGAAGYNGAGAGGAAFSSSYPGGGGGGGSSMIKSGVTLEAAAGGGGGGAGFGSGTTAAGGSGGGTSGNPGNSSRPGGGGTQSAGGAAGGPPPSSYCGTSATAGSSAQGGAGGIGAGGVSGASGSGGGGGGYFGGGGGDCGTATGNGGGGGGSGYDALLTGASMTTGGGNSGNGQVAITWTTGGAALAVQDVNSNTYFNVNSVTGSTLVKGGSTTAFQVQNTSSADLLQIDTSSNNITLGGNNSATLQSWSTNSNSLSAAAQNAVTLTANGYVYVIGGSTVASSGASCGTAITTAQFAKLNADGSTGSWTTTTALPAARCGATGLVANGYVYVMGGNNSGSQTTVYFARLNSDGTLGSWQTNANALPAARDGATAATANGYIYFISGESAWNGSGQTTLYYAKLNSDGSTGSWTTATPNRGSLWATAAVANGYLYVIGGYSAATEVDYSPLNATTGAPGTWNTTSVLPNNTYSATTVVANGYVYVLGGSISTYLSAATTNIYYAQLNSNGTVGSWGTNNNALPAAEEFAGSVASNGYIYEIGGESNGNSGTVSSSVYYSSTQRIKIGGSLDLVGLSGSSGLASNGSPGYGSVGGSLTAGDTTIVGTLQVAGQANFSNTVNINGALGVGSDISTTGNVYTNSGHIVDGIGGNGYLVMDYGPSQQIIFRADTVQGNISSWTNTAHIDAAGNMVLKGTLTQSGAPDVAETIPAASDVGYYDVVSSNPDGSVSAVKSQVPYDPTAIGVISDGTSSLKINSNSYNADAPLNGQLLVLAGRVPVHVTNEGGAIAPGDYLTTSSTPGYAMKATHAGPIIGTALAAFNSASGTVMVQTHLGYWDGPTSTDYVQNGGSATLSSLTVSGTSDFSDINVSGTATVNNLDVTGSASIASANIGNLTVTGSTTLATLHVTGSAQFDGDITIGGHIITAGGQPTSQVQAAAGTVAANDLNGKPAAVTITGNDTSGTITITTSDNPTAGDLVKFIFSKAYGAAPRIVLSPANDKAAGLRFFSNSPTTTDFMFDALDTPAPNTTYTYNYFIVQ